MEPYALQTATMLNHAFKPPSEHLGLPTKRESAPKPRLPTKRKRDTICGLGDFNKPFTIKPCAATPYDKPYTFKPVRIIGRAQLPLSLLDSAADDFASNRLFAANIDLLEKHNDAHAKNNEASRVLIARCETKKTLYVVERVEARVYSLCKLAAWLKEKDVAELWDPESLDTYPKFPQMEDPIALGGEWWMLAVVDAQQAEQPMKRVRTSMLRRPVPEPTAVDPQSLPANTDPTAAENASQSAETDMLTMQPPAPLTPQEQLEGLVEQYLNAIYMSRTSLAYFAKGPIARVRSAFTSPEEGAPQTYELVEFIRGMLLSHKAEGRKYGEKLPEVIKNIPPGFMSDDEEDAKKKRKKPKKKVKLSIAGMYPQEADVVKKWWVGEMPHGGSFGEETIDQRIKRRLADLRVREALAQMILMLEIVSLEALSTYKKPPENDGVNDATQAQDESQPKPKKRKKKLDDINLLLDLLLDKLCIWQSVEEAGILDFDAPKQGGSSDRLQSFCIEVIVPFYMNRLPEQARMVNKKLGGPATSSPPKRKAAKPPTTSRKSGDSKEPEPKKSRRSFARTSTDTTGQIGQRRALSLGRSTTDSALLNGIKREGSEARLSAIPLQRSPSQAARRSMSTMRILKGREIDLEATSAAAEAKRLQKKRVEDDLKDAISTLKKPNRGLAAGSYVDDVERRGFGSGKSRKPTTTVRKPQKDVQVSATPHAVRRFAPDMIQRTPMHHYNPFAGHRQTDTPRSGDFCVPSSGIRPASFIVPGTVQRSTAARTFVEPSVADTPSRPIANKTSNSATNAEPSVADTPSRPPSLGNSFVSKSSTNRTLFVTPLKRRAVSPDDSPPRVDATPSKVIASSPPEIMRTTHPRLLFATPLKQGPKSAEKTSELDGGLPSGNMAKEQESEPDIFDALGWND